MRKQLLLSAIMLFSSLANAHDIEVANADGVTIYYNYANNGTELSVTYRGGSYDSYKREYSGNIVIPEEVIYMNKTLKVTSIRERVFYGCPGVTSVTIPNSVTSIGDNVFLNCLGLTSITIPNSVRTISKNAFDNVYIPTVISLIENPSGIAGKNSIFNVFSQTTFVKATLYVPVGTIDKYKAKEGWKDFVFIEEGVPANVTGVCANTLLIQSEEGIIRVQGFNDGNQVSVYTIDGKQVGSAIIQDNIATIVTNIQHGSIAIVKVGDKVSKIMMK